MADDKKNEPNEEQLDDIEDEIERARRDGDEAIHGSFYEGEEHPMFRGGTDEAPAEGETEGENLAP